jgi:hypothetical protein
MAALTIAGCESDAGGRSSAGGAGPALIAVDSVLLAEADTLYLGNPFSLAIDPWDGSFYVSDFFANRVFRFSRDGSLMRSYGRPGSGPGEFMAPNLVFALDERTLVASDQRHKLFQLYDRDSGAFLRGIPYEGRLGMTPPVAANGLIWAPSRNPATGTAALAWDVRTDSIRYLPALPDEYVTSLARRGWFASFYSTGTVAAWADSVIVGMSGGNDLILHHADGTVLDTVRVPVVRRRGVPANHQQRVDEDRKLETDELFRIASLLYHVHRTPDGSLLVVHHDSDLEGEIQGGVITARPFVTVISPDRRRACVDAELPVSPDARPIQGFRGDTLFLLDRRILPDETLETWVVKYRVDAENCDWVAIR